MGLDNFPNKYPCKAQGTAVMVQRTNHEGVLLTEEDGSPSMAVDCQASQACGGCPYKNAFDKSGLAGGAVYGMFGTDCWYRGKYGNYLLSASGYDTDERNFYGDDEEGTLKSAESCKNLADFIKSIIDEDADENGAIYDDDNENLVPQLKYAEWYLRWASEECDGLGAWY